MVILQAGLIRPNSSSSFDVAGSSSKSRASKLQKLLPNFTLINFVASECKTKRNISIFILCIHHDSPVASNVYGHNLFNQGELNLMQKIHLEKYMLGELMREDLEMVL